MRAGSRKPEGASERERGECGGGGDECGPEAGGGERGECGGGDGECRPEWGGEFRFRPEGASEERGECVGGGKCGLAGASEVSAVVSVVVVGVSAGRRGWARSVRCLCW